MRATRKMAHVKLVSRRGFKYFLGPVLSPKRKINFRLVLPGISKFKEHNPCNFRCEMHASLQDVCATFYVIHVEGHGWAYLKRLHQILNSIITRAHPSRRTNNNSPRQTPASSAGTS